MATGSTTIPPEPKRAQQTAETVIARKRLKQAPESLTSISRDRNGEFEPKILPKNQTSVSTEIEGKIISMYAKGMTTSGIEVHIKDIYGMDISDTTVSRITDIILPEAQEYQHNYCVI